jgi:hypothetical protein
MALIAIYFLMHTNEWKSGLIVIKILIGYSLPAAYRMALFTVGAKSTLMWIKMTIAAFTKF